MKEPFFVDMPKAVFTDLVQDKKYEGISILALSLRHYNEHCASTVIVVDELMDYFDKANKSIRVRQARIKQGIEDLRIELNGKRYANIKLNDLFRYDNNCIRAFNHHIDKILSSDMKLTVDRYKLITLYLAVMSRMNQYSNDEKLSYCFIKHTDLKKETDLSLDSVKAYLKILANLEILIGAKDYDTYVLPDYGLRRGSIVYGYCRKDEKLNNLIRIEIKKLADKYKQSKLDKGWRIYVKGMNIKKPKEPKEIKQPRQQNIFGILKK